MRLHGQYGQYGCYEEVSMYDGDLLACSPVSDNSDSEAGDESSANVRRPIRNSIPTPFKRKLEGHLRRQVVIAFTFKL